jgi:hypothetical protein
MEVGQLGVHGLLATKTAFIIVGEIVTTPNLYLVEHFVMV